MADTLRIKRRTGGGGAGAPASLANAELAYNEMDDTLYYGKGTGGAGGSATTVVPIGGPGAFAPLNSPALVGVPTAPTATTGTSTGQLATTAYVMNAMTAAGSITEAPSDGKFYARRNAAWADTAPAYVDVTGDTMTGALNISTAATTPLTVATTDTGTASGPTLVLDRNKAGQAASDYVGNILFRGRDSLGNPFDYGEINSQIINVTDGTEAGQMTFRVGIGGNAQYNMLTLNSSGAYVNGPLQATTGTFSGALSATTGTFSGQVTANPNLVLNGASASVTVNASSGRPALNLQSTVTPSAPSNGGYIGFLGYTSTGTNKTVGQYYVNPTSMTEGAESITHVWSGMSAGTLTTLMTLSGTTCAITPKVASNEFCAPNATSYSRLSGGSGGNLGANVELYGESHASIPNQAFYDASTHTFRGQPTNTILMTISSAGNVSCTANCYADAFICNAGGIYFIGDTAAVLGTAASKNGPVYLRPNGYNSGANQSYANSDGTFHIVTGSLYMDNNTVSGIFQGAGTRGKPGQSAAYASNWINFHWNGTNHLGYVDGTYTGYLTPPSDYRIKKDVENLNSTWENVKALRPISYTHADFTPPAEMPDIKELNDKGEEVTRVRESVFKADDIKRWGFIAHELQEALLPSAADGEKDGDQPQCPSLMPILAALTKALQEAMLRIEALEARP